jgi:hypothetical protein
MQANSENDLLVGSGTSPRWNECTYVNGKRFLRSGLGAGLLAVTVQVGARLERMYLRKLTGEPVARQFVSNTCNVQHLHR